MSCTVQSNGLPSIYIILGVLSNLEMIVGSQDTFRL